jgi:hypothetical protein
MTLKTMQEIRRDLDETFLPLEARGITGMRLLDGGLPEETIARFEERLGTLPWPAEFREFLCRYDFGDLTLGLVHFCGNGRYLDSLAMFNSSPRRPPELLVVASSDPHLILLNLDDGSVLALANDLGWDATMPVARDFELFMRGLATMAEARARRAAPPSLAKAIAAEVGAPESPYWLTWVR